MSGDPSIRVGINMPASLYMRLRQLADVTPGFTISRLCRDGALREIERLEALERAGKP